MFVSESFLVGSAADNKAVIIEKTPDTLGVYDPQSDHIMCSNHFQSELLAGSEPNIEQMKKSASAYRYERLQELMQEKGKNTVQKTAAILRDRKGLHDTDIGLGNEKAMNQFIAHHAIIFEPKKLLVWVSTAPWQLGEFVAYDLHSIFALHGLSENRELYDSTLTIPPDSFLLTTQFQQFEKFREYKRRIADGEAIDPDSLVASNPQFYHAYVLAGDYCYRHNQPAKAEKYYEQALTKEIATVNEEEYIKKQLEEIKKNPE
jgi:hypothetical protein